MQDILDVARRRGADAEVFEVSTRESSIEFENNRLKRAETVDRAGLAIRVIHSGRLGFATSSLPGDALGLLDRAMATAAIGKEAAFAFPGANAVPAVAVFDENVSRTTPEEMVAAGEELIEPLRRADPKFKAYVSLTAADTTAILANTSGFRSALRKTIYGGSVGGILVEGENFLELGEGHYHCDKHRGLPPLRDRVLRHLAQGRTNVSIQSGRYSVLFAPTAVASLLGPIIACLNGKAVQKGASPFRGRLGEEILDRSFTLYDDPLRPYAPATASFDAEGLPSGRTALIERGAIRGFFLDLDTAAALGMPPSGNGRRGGWSSPPAPGPSTLVLATGTGLLQDMLGGIREGLIVHHFLGAGQGNPYGGSISVNVLLGFVVRNGEILGRVKNTMLAVNVFELFRAQLAALSDEAEEVRGAMSLPYLLAEGVSITSRDG